MLKANEIKEMTGLKNEKYEKRARAKAEKICKSLNKKIEQVSKCGFDYLYIEKKEYDSEMLEKIIVVLTENGYNTKSFDEAIRIEW